MEAKDIFSQEELLRYSRHLLIPEFGLAGQQKLKQSKALVVGAGGLGSPVLLYLAAAGVGTIGIVDGDVVDQTNLQRQILYDTSLIGQSKARSAAQRINLLNPHVTIEIHDEMLTTENVMEIFHGYDLIIDGTDNFPTRYLINDACVLSGKILVYGSIFQFEGQVSVFNMQDKNGLRGPNYRDLFPDPPPPGMVPSCAEGGVLGVLPGIIGSMQANEAIKILSGVGSTLNGRLFIFDAYGFTSVTLNIQKNPAVKPIEKLIDYEAFCGVVPVSTISHQMEVDASSLSEILNNPSSSVQLVDVRQAHEYLLGDIGGTKIPLHQLDDHITKINRTGKVIVYCQTGVRSQKAILHLQTQHGFDNLFNLRGGISTYLQEVSN